MNTWFGIHWGAWHLAPFLIGVLCVAAVLLGMRWRNQRRLIDMITAPEHVKDLLSNVSRAKQIVRIMCIAAVCVLLCGALLRPQWDRKDERIEQEGRDLVIGLDISKSMLAEDYSPNRLTWAKQKIKNLVNALSAERVALVVFSGDAIVQCPLTRDYAAFFMFLDEVDVESISSGTTSIGSALQKTIDMFSSGSQRKHKLLALFTDGEEFVSNAEELHQQVKDTGLRPFTIGVGSSEGAPIPCFDLHGNKSGFKRDQHGDVVITRCNEELAKQFSEACGGVYIGGKDDDQDIHRLTSWVTLFEKEQYGDTCMKQFQEKYYYFAGIAWILLILEWLI